MEILAKEIIKITALSLELAAAVVVAAALIKLIVRYFIIFFKPQTSLSATDTRVQFGSTITVSLELLLGADVLETAISPGWDDIGKLAAIATIRTLLNYFLERELKHTPTRA